MPRTDAVAHRSARAAAAPAGETWDFTTDRRWSRQLAAQRARPPDSASRSARRTSASGRRRPGRRCSTTCSRCAAGLEALGFEPGDALAGDRRQPPAPLSRHARRRRAAAAFAIAGLSRTRRPTSSATSRRRRSRASRSPRTRSRSTSCSTCASTARPIEHIVYDDPRGLGAYPQPGLLAWDELVARGAERACRRARPARRADQARAGRTTRRCWCIRRARPASRRASLLRTATCSAACATRIAAGAFRVRRGASSPTCRWPGSATSRSRSAPASRCASPINIPGAAGDRAARPARGRADVLSRGAARLGQHAHAHPGRHGGFDAAEEVACYDLFMNSRAGRARAAQARRAGEPTLRERLLRPFGEWLVCGPIKDQLGMTRMRNALHRRRGARRGHVRVLPRARRQAAAALRPDREQRATTRCRTSTRSACTRSAGRCRASTCSIGEAGEILVRSESVFDGYYEMPEAIGRGARGRLAAHRRRRLPRARRPSRRARPRQRSRAHRDGRALHPELHREPPEVQPVRPQRRRARQRAATSSPRSSASTRKRSATGPRSAASRTCRTPTCRSARGARAGRRRGPARQRDCCPTACSCAASSACTRSSMPTTARSRAPASCAATSSRSATRPIIEALYDGRRAGRDEGADHLRERATSASPSGSLTVQEVA